MPRQSRVDATGALHHIIVRGIERRKIFDDDEDRESFLKRLGLILGGNKDQLLCMGPDSQPFSPVT